MALPAPATFLTLPVELLGASAIPLTATLIVLVTPLTLPLAEPRCDE
jgi:hypothetical protein